LGSGAIPRYDPGRTDASGAPNQKPRFPREKARRAGMPHEPKSSIEASHFSPDTLEFIRFLGAYHVQYVVVGGEAVIYHGYPHLTGDVDFFFSDIQENVRGLFDALKEFWSGNVPGIQSADEFAEPGIVIQFGRPPNRIDLLQVPPFHVERRSLLESDSRFV